MEKGTPIVTEMQVIPVAGYDSMLMTLSGAHAPWFTRNLVILKPARPSVCPDSCSSDSPHSVIAVI